MSFLLLISAVFTGLLTDWQQFSPEKNLLAVKITVKDFFARLRHFLRNIQEFIVFNCICKYIYFHLSSVKKMVGSSRKASKYAGLTGILRGRIYSTKIGAEFDPAARPGPISAERGCLKV